MTDASKPSPPTHISAPPPGPSPSTMPGLDCNQENTTISSSEDIASKISQCNVYNGNIVILDYNSEDIIMDNITTINGNLIISNTVSTIISLSFANLSSVNGTLALSGLSDIESPNFPKLRNIGKLDVSNSTLKTLNIFDNSPLISIPTVSIGANPNITSISLPMATVGQLDISTNPWNNKTWPNVTFPKLRTVQQSISVSYIQTFEAASLETIGGDATFAYTTIVKLILNNLKSVGSSFDIIKPYSMNTLGLDNLKTVGTLPGSVLPTFEITSSAFLQNITLPALTEVYGVLFLGGNFSAINLPSLTTVESVVVTQTGELNGVPFNCTEFFSAYAPQITNEITCINQSIHVPPMTSSTATASSLIGSATTTSTGISPHFKSSSSGLSTGAKAGIGVGVGLVALALLVILGAFMLRFRRRKPSSEVSQDQSKLDYSPMIGVPAEPPQYHDAIPMPMPNQRESRNYSNIQTGGAADRGLVVDEGDRAVSPVSIDDRMERTSFGSRSVSPESIDRVPLGTGGGRE